MSGLVAAIAQQGHRLVFFNVLLQQIGVPVPAEPTLIVAGSLAGRGRLSVSGHRARCAGGHAARRSDLVRDRKALRRARSADGLSTVVVTRATAEPDRTAALAMGTGGVCARQVHPRPADGRSDPGGRNGNDASGFPGLRSAGHEPVGRRFHRARRRFSARRRSRAPCARSPRWVGDFVAGIALAIAIAWRLAKVRSTASRAAMLGHSDTPARASLADRIDATPSVLPLAGTAGSGVTSRA